MKWMSVMTSWIQTGANWMSSHFSWLFLYVMMGQVIKMKDLLMVLPRKMIQRRKPLPERYEFVSYTKRFHGPWITLCKQAGYTAVEAEMFLQDPENIEENFVFVIDQVTHKLVGIGGLIQDDAFLTKRSCIDCVSVDPSVQRQGIGSSIVNALVLKYERKPSKYPIYVRTDIAYWPSIILFSRLGFTPYLGQSKQATKKQNEKKWEHATNVLREKTAS